MEIWICDDHALVRAGLHQLLQLGFPGLSVQEFSSVQEILQAHAEGPSRPDLIIQDLNLGDQAESGLEVLKACAQTPILVLTMHQSDYHRKLCAQYGAVAYFAKAETSDALISAVQQILQAPSSPASIVEKSLPKVRLLSPAEKRVCQHIVSGMKFTEIAVELGVTQSTIATHKKRIMAKLGVKTIADLVAVLKAGY